MTTNQSSTTDFDLGDDLVIGSVERRGVGKGAWVEGTLAGHEFQALVFPAPAEVPEYEVGGGDSRISKLWLRRLSERAVVYNWDRGANRKPADAAARAVVDFLAAGLAEHVYGA